MSKPYVSPYRRNPYNNNLGPKSPLREQSSKLAEKSKLSHSVIADNYTAEKSRMNHTPEHGYRYTQKKHYHVNQHNNRLDTLLEQNKFLLAENNELSNVVTDRNRMIMSLQQKLEDQIAQEVQTLEQIQYQKNRFLEEFSLKIREQNIRNQRLMDEIAQLNQDIYQLQLGKSREIQNLKENFSREHRKQLDHILNTHAQSIDIMNIEANKNKSVILEQQQNIIQCQNEIKMLKQSMEFAENQHKKKLAHTIHVHNIELSQQKLSNDSKMQSNQKELENALELTTHQLEGEISSLKKQLNAKANEISLLNTQLLTTDVEKENHLEDLQTRIAELEAQLIGNEQNYRNKLVLERQNLNKTSQTQLQSNQQCYEQMINNLKNQIDRLRSLNDTKTKQIQSIRSLLDEERIRRQSIIRQGEERERILKQAWNDDQEIHQEEDEGFKIKMAHLRKADLSALRNYYENQMGIMAEELKEKEDIINMNRQKVHNELQEKNQMRKQFQIQVSKLKGRIGQLQLKISGMLLERKDEIANIESRMEVTSMTLVRQTTERQKHSKFVHGEKRQLQQIINGKDKQIQQLFQKIKMMGENHHKQIEKKEEEIEILRSKIEAIEMQLKKQKLFYENQLQKKTHIHENDKKFYESELSRVKKELVEEYNALNHQYSNEKSQLEQAKQHLQRENQQLNQKLSHLLQANEQTNLENQAALHETRNHLETSKSLLEVSLKNYYDTQLKAKDKEISQLKAQIKQLNTDIRTGKERENKLSEKMSKLVRGEEKLKEMEEKVLAMGQQNNIVKNLADIVKKKQRKI